MTDHVRFVDRFVGQVELTRWLEAADVFVTPYPNLEQIVSGTLSYAMGAGRVIVSTPYAYASELLADGRGVLVPPGSPSAFAAAINGVLADDELRAEIGAARLRAQSADGLVGGRRPISSPLRPRRSRHLGRDLTRDAGGRQCLTGQRPRSCPPRPTVTPPTSRPARRPRNAATVLPKADRRHLDVLTDGIGIMQHAIRSRPDPAHGYCVDDVARALEVDLLHARVARLADGRRTGLAQRPVPERSLRHVTGTVPQLPAVDGSWIDGTASEDSQGRAMHRAR